jgi:hypothetical protein
MKNLSPDQVAHNVALYRDMMTKPDFNLDGFRYGYCESCGHSTMATILYVKQTIDGNNLKINLICEECNNTQDLRK